MPKLKYLAPNGVTATSLILGLASMALSADGQFELAAWFIVWGTLLDKLDGTLARLLRATSAFGVEFDSFADFVSFGLAPAALVYYAANATGNGSPAVTVAAGAYGLALAIRLARFNVSEPPGGHAVFFGIPGTLCGAIVSTAMLVVLKYDKLTLLTQSAPWVLGVLAVLMVSQLRIPKVKPRASRAMNALQGSHILLVYVFGALRIYPEYLFGLAVTFLVGGVAACGLSGAPPEEPPPGDTEDGEPSVVAP